MSEGQAAEAERAARRLDLDWVRIGCFALLILYHVAMFYAPWSWNAKSPRPQSWLPALMVGAHPWRLSLLFLVSGAATRFVARGTSPGVLARRRVLRLLPPLLFGMLVVVPPQSWVQVAEMLHQPPRPYGAFWIRYVTASGCWCDSAECLITPAWNHLWFVAYLLAYTLGLTAVLAAAPGALRTAERLTGRALSGAGVLLWPALWCVAVRLTLAPHFPDTYALVGDWTLHAVSVPAFLFGYLIAQADGVWAALVRFRWSAAALALAGWAALAAGELAWPVGGVTPPQLARRVLRVAYGVDQWAWITAVLGFARLHLATADGPARRYLTEAIFPFYVVHQTATVVAGHFLALLHLPLAVEALGVTAATALACVAVFEVVRRVGWLRPLLGLRRRAPSAHRLAAPLAGVGLGAAGEHAVLRQDVGDWDVAERG